MSTFSFTGNKVSFTYQRLLQISDGGDGNPTGIIYDGFGATVTIANANINNLYTTVQGLIDNGIPGSTGATGVQGFQGLTGFQGPAMTGDQGPIGATGIQGFTGPQGFTGSQGPAMTGDQGPIGPTGIQGFTGPQGFTGVQGPAGTTGQDGFTGVQGPTGVQGFTGNQGSIGETGFQGYTGPQGPPGSVTGQLVVPFSNTLSQWVIHNTGQYPIVQVLDNLGRVLIPSEITHNSVNDFQVTFATSSTGNIIVGGAAGPTGFQGPTGGGGSGLNNGDPLKYSNGATAISFNYATISAWGNIVPSEHYTFDLGSTQSRWNNLYVKDIFAASQSVYIGELKLSTDGTNLLVNNQTIEARSNSFVTKTLISGGAEWSGSGLTFSVSNLTYTFTGEILTSPATQVGLRDGDALNSRIDAIVVGDDKIISVIEGTPSPDPATPEIPEDQLLIQYVIVGANETVPTLQQEYVYLDGSEWTPISYQTSGTQSGTVSFFSTTPSPYQGIYCINSNNDQRTGLRFTRFANINLSSYTLMTLRVRFNSVIPTTHSLQATLFINTTQQGAIVNLMNVGLNRSLTGVWQQVIVPMSLFGSITNVNRLQLRMAGGVNFQNIQYAVDFIQFQTGVATPTVQNTIVVQQAGTSIGTRPRINLISGTGISTTITDDPLNERVNITITNSGGAGSGSQGATGHQGVTGPQGFTGVQGLTGVQGATGSQGFTGNQGQTGPQGTTGQDGTPGNQGPTGPQGATGQDGTPGSQGPTGPAGSGSNVSIDDTQVAFGSVSGLTSSASFIFDNSKRNLKVGYGATIYNADNSSIVGGFSNEIKTFFYYTTNLGNFIGSGSQNKINLLESGVGGNVIGGGSNNVIDNYYDGGKSLIGNSSIVGGSLNETKASSSFIGGGYQNSISSTGIFSTILSGCKNVNKAPGSAILGGGNNEIELKKSGRTYGFSVISGGKYNYSLSDFSVIGGGYFNCSTFLGTQVSGKKPFTVLTTVIGGGSENYIKDTGPSSILGGFKNKIYPTGTPPTITLGNVIVGGEKNVIYSRYYSTDSPFGGSIIVGGFANKITPGTFSGNFIGGGSGNCITGDDSGILGGVENEVVNNCTFIIGSGITTNRNLTTFVNNLSIVDIPTSDAGLPEGSVWHCGDGILRIVLGGGGGGSKPGGGGGGGGGGGTPPIPVRL